MKKILFCLFISLSLIFILPAYSQEYSTPSLCVFTQDTKPTPELTKLLNYFHIEATSAAEIVKATQKMWLRAEGKERWEVQDPYANRKAELMPLFKDNNLVDEIKPQLKEYDYLLMMGALHERVKLRLEYAIQLWQEGYRFKEIVFLGSERKLDPEKEPATLYKKEIIPQTEYQMMKWLYDNTAIPTSMKEIKTTFINTPDTIDAKGNKKRANTGDTINEWRKNNPQPGTCLAVSNQPYVGYQLYAIKFCLPSSCIVNVCGQALAPETRVADILDTAARWIYQENKNNEKK